MPNNRQAPVSTDANLVEPKSNTGNIVGSGLNLELELKSGTSIDVVLRQDNQGQIRDLQVDSDAPLTDGQLVIFKRFMNDLDHSVDQLFSQQKSNADIFSFANQAGIANVELSVQQDIGGHKQTLEFDKLISPTGRKEVNAQWLSFNRDSGVETQHNLALSREALQTKSATGGDYQWLLENIKSGIDVMGLPSESTGALNADERAQLYGFFSSGIHVLFDQTQKSMGKLESMGASQSGAKKFIEQSVSAFSGKASDKKSGNTGAAGGSAFKYLSDFKADFYSQQTARNGDAKEDEYKFSMEVSQSSRWMNQKGDGTEENKNSLMQNRRLLVQYEHVGNLQKFEFNWQHDEKYKADYINQVLQQSRFTIQDVNNSKLTSLIPDTNGNYSTQNSRSQFTNTKQYNADDSHAPIGSVLGGGYRV